MHVLIQLPKVSREPGNFWRLKHQSPLDYISGTIHASEIALRNSGKTFDLLPGSKAMPQRIVANHILGSIFLSAVRRTESPF